MNSTLITYSDDGDLVYFRVNLNELFDINLQFPGIKSKIREALRISKQYVPIKTGLLRSSYSIRYEDNHSFIVYFDPEPLIAKQKVYYAKYLVDKPKTRNWLEKVIRQFYNNLLIGIKELNKEIEKKDKERKLISFALALSFLKKLNEGVIKDERQSI